MLPKSEKDNTSKAAIERSCGACMPRNPSVNEGWWKEFGLAKNPYIYGPMPRMRTSERYRMEEARRMGWMAWTWNDEYTEERKGFQPQRKKYQLDTNFK